MPAPKVCLACLFNHPLNQSNILITSFVRWPNTLFQKKEPKEFNC